MLSYNVYICNHNRDSAQSLIERINLNSHLKLNIMTKTNHLMILILLLGMVGCQSHDELASSPDIGGDKSALSEVRSIEDAIEIANNVMELLATTPEQTRNLEVRKVKSVSCVGSEAATRSEATDSLLYLINYDDDLGFAVIGRSVYSRPLYAFSDSGSISMTDTIKNKGLAMFFEDTFNDLAIGGDLIPINPHPIYVANRVDPLLNENVAKWDQEYPFNQSAPYVNGVQGLTGCGPVAVGMLLTYYRYPSVIGTKKINWDNLMNNDYEEISQYLEALASPQYLNSYYLKESSGRATPYENFIPAFKKLGLDTTYNWNYARFLDKRRELYSFMKMGYRAGGSVVCMPAPVIFYGGRITVDGIIEEEKYHVWIVDGYMDMATRNGIDSESIEQDPYLHCVWGAGGGSNGYFLYSRVNDTMANKNGEVNRYGYKMCKMIGRLGVPELFSI